MSFTTRRAEDLATMRREFLDASLLLDADIARSEITNAFDYLRAVIDSKFMLIRNDIERAHVQ